jgi:hypothetical protein
MFNGKPISMALEKEIEAYLPGGVIETDDYGTHILIIPISAHYDRILSGCREYTAKAPRVIY